MTIIQIMGAELADTCFSIETPDEGEIVWNVSKIQRAADRGDFGPAPNFDMSILPAPRYDLGFLDKAKIEAFKRSAEIMARPALAVEAPVPGHIRCFVDGQHRLTARYELGLRDFSAFVVPIQVERDFRITIESGKNQ